MIKLSLSTFAICDRIGEDFGNPNLLCDIMKFKSVGEREFYFLICENFKEYNQVNNSEIILRNYLR